ncbi:MAG: hypothetical protein SFU91_05910 [Chloroherpetonaceae bacterium]|nr:hypothetical protein [Chloroherpetonaceae bacterium]
MKQNHLWMGIALIALGVVFLGKQFFDVSFGTAFKYAWPIFLIGIATFQMSTRSIPIWGGAMLITVGVLFEIKYLGLFPPNFFSILWPIGLIAAGTWILITRARKPDMPMYSDDRTSAFGIFSGGVYKIQSQAYEGGSLFSVFGGVDLDLRSAMPVVSGAIIDTVIVFAGGKIRVPEGWKVIVTGLPLFGGIENKTDKYPVPTDAPVLYIKALVVFGGLEIKPYVTPFSKSAELKTETV